MSTTPTRRIGAVSAGVRPQSSRRSGIPWFVFMVAMWTAFLLLLLRDGLDDVWQWARELPLLVELGVWLLAFPWLLGTAVWESSWAPSLRVLLVASFAVGWTLISIPRTKT